jgi:hypothetical protein
MNPSLTDVNTKYLVRVPRSKEYDISPMRLREGKIAGIDDLIATIAHIHLISDDVLMASSTSSHPSISHTADYLSIAPYSTSTLTVQENP